MLRKPGYRNLELNVGLDFSEWDFVCPDVTIRSDGFRDEQQRDGTDSGNGSDTRKLDGLARKRRSPRRSDR